MRDIGILFSRKMVVSNCWIIQFIDDEGTQIVPTALIAVCIELNFN